MASVETTTSAVRYAGLLAAVLLVALNHRPGVASIAPLLEDIRADLGLGYTAAGFLTTLPVLCMGLFPVAAARLAERLGLERSLFAGLMLLALATAARLAGMNPAVLFASALLIGIAVAANQTLAPAFIKARFSQPLLVMGLYATTITVGAGLPAAFAVPLARDSGSWPMALAFWALPAIVAAVVWWRAVGLPLAPTARVAAGGTPWRTRRGWLIAFLSSGAFGTFFAILAWTSPLYAEQGWSAERASLLLTLVIACQITGNLAFAVLAHRARDRRLWIISALLVLIAGIAGMALAPLAAPWLWAALAGLGGGGLFPLVMNLPLDDADDPAAVARLTAMAQSAGYLMAAPLPAFLGWLRGLSDGFAVPYLSLVVFSAAMIVAVSRLRPRLA